MALGTHRQSCPSVSPSPSALPVEDSLTLLREVGLARFSVVRAHLWTPGSQVELEGSTDKACVW